MRTALLFLFLLSVTGIAAGQETADWHQVRPSSEAEDAGCGFSAMMPATPKATSRKMRMSTKVLRAFSQETFEAGVTYVVTCSEYPQPAAVNTKEKARFVLRRTAKAQLAGSGKTPTDIKTASGHPGVAYDKPLQGNAILRQRAYFVGSKLYQLSVADLPGNAASEAKRFFESFEVKKTGTD